MLSVSETLDLLTTHPTMRISTNQPDWDQAEPLMLIGWPQYHGVLMWGSVQDHLWEFHSFVIGVN